MKFKLHVFMTKIAFRIVIRLLQYLDQYLYEANDEIRSQDIVYWIDRDFDCFEYRIKNDI